jgi:hypothetical protein
MTPDQEIPTPKRQLVIHANYELFALALAVLQVVNSVLWVLLRDQEEGRVLLLTSVGISLFFIADSAYRWLRAPDRRGFLLGRRGWLLWLGSLPVPFIALLRILWYWWAIRNLRRSDYSDMVQIVVEKRAQTTLLASSAVWWSSSRVREGLPSAPSTGRAMTASEGDWPLLSRVTWTTSALPSPSRSPAISSVRSPAKSPSPSSPEIELR